MVVETMDALAAEPNGFVDWYGLLVEESQRRERPKALRASTALPILEHST